MKPTTDLDAAPLLEALLHQAPEDTATALVLAQLYRRHEMESEARTVLKRALHYRPADAALWEQFVKVTRTLEEEEAAYREMTSRFPDEAKYAVALGTTLVNLNQHAKAREVLQPLAEKHESGLIRGLAWYHLARSRFRQNQPKEALQAFEEADKADPETISTAASQLFLGRVQEKLGRSREARTAYEDALAMRPTTPRRGWPWCGCPGRPATSPKRWTICGSTA